MKDKTYKYHVAYSIKKNGGIGMGAITITLREKIDNEETIKSVTDFIKQDCGEGTENIILLNWIKIK